VAQGASFGSKLFSGGLGALVGLFLLAVVVVVSNTCRGACEWVPCTMARPCTVEGKAFTVGTACTAEREGKVCSTHWFASNCYCRTVLGNDGVPSAGCRK
jgi:hypothetical protein